ncbi:MAG: NAD(P)/FAD-dependent oxidoreductase [Lachnospiraceae bacterium]|nr:NAD(P)/FAD-dependent oxidoreductase [Lachnospiraceae bacterium]
MREAIANQVKEAFPEIFTEISVDERKIVTLRGECRSWGELVEIGHYVAHMDGVKNVVNEMTVTGMEIPRKDYAPFLEAGKKKGVIDKKDVVIIGAGVSGCGIARELSKYHLSIAVVEMSDDVCTGASKANNGDIHPGHSVKPGTLKAKLNVQGNRMYDKWAEELNFRLDRCGAMGAICDQKMMPALEQAYQAAIINGVDGVELVDGPRAMELVPELREYDGEITAAIWLPSMAVVEPYEVVVALAENAANNGVTFLFNTTAADVLTENGQVKGVVTSRGIIEADYVINCAGVYADEISAMAGDKSYTIHARKGTIAILDKNQKPAFASLTSVLTGAEVQNSSRKNKESKGGGTCRTPEWNILLGPSATEVPDKEDNTTTPEDVDYAMATNLNEKVGKGDIIRIFAGVRPADYKEDFIIEMSPVTHGFINVGGIQSPGLASAPAIAQMVEEILLEDCKTCQIPVTEKSDYNPINPKKVEFRHMTRGEQDALIQKDPRYGRIICRCESITEGEILDAIHSPLVPGSIDAIKRRTRAGMGRCQGGFCQPRVLEILARELGKDKTEIYQKDGDSQILYENNRRVALGGKES